MEWSNNFAFHALRLFGKWVDDDERVSDEKSTNL